MENEKIIKPQGWGADQDQITGPSLGENESSNFPES